MLDLFRVEILELFLLNLNHSCMAKIIHAGAGIMHMFSWMTFISVKTWTASHSGLYKRLASPFLTVWDQDVSGQPLSCSLQPRQPPHHGG